MINFTFYIFNYSLVICRRTLNKKEMKVKLNYKKHKSLIKIEEI